MKLSTQHLALSTLLLLAALAGGATTAPTRPTSGPTSQPAPITINVPDFGGDYLQRLNAVSALAAKAAPRPVKLVIPPGLHTLSSAWVPTFSNVEIAGEGATLRMRNAGPIDASGDLVRLQNCHHVRLHGLTLDGNSQTRAWSEVPHNLRVLYGSDIEICGIRSINAPCDDIFIWGGGPLASIALVPSSVHVHDCMLSGPARSCISVVGGANVLIENIVFSGAQSHGPAAAVDVEANPGDAAPAINGVIVRNCVAVDCQGGLRANGAAGAIGIQFVGNGLSNCRDGIQVFGASGTVIQSNALAGGLGIGINACDACNVCWNTLDTGCIYADTAGMANPKGHTILGNVAHSWSGAATAAGNITR